MNRKAKKQVQEIIDEVYREIMECDTLKETKITVNSMDFALDMKLDNILHNAEDYDLINNILYWAKAKDIIDEERKEDLENKFLYKEV